MTDKKLTPKKAAFVDEYPIDRNATQAAIRAGFSEKTARSQGQRLLTNVDIQQALEEKLKSRSERCEIDADYVLTKIKAEIERASREDDNHDASAVYRGAELLGKHLAMWTDKTELSGTIGIADAILKARGRSSE